MKKSFKERFSFEKRSQEASRIMKKYPDRVPIIVEKDSSSDISDIDKHKYLVPKDLTVSQFIYVIRKRIKLQPEQAIFLFVNNSLPPISCLMSEIYEENADECGFLFCVYAGEATFG